eukprot:4114968-Amphidinium_carterae.1
MQFQRVLKNGTECTQAAKRQLSKKRESSIASDWKKRVCRFLILDAYNALFTQAGWKVELVCCSIMSGFGLNKC